MDFRKLAGFLWPIGGTVLALFITPLAIDQYPEFFKDNPWALPVFLMVAMACWIIPFFLHKGIWIWVASRRRIEKSLLGIVFVAATVAIYIGAGRLFHFHVTHIANAIKKQQSSIQRTVVQTDGNPYLVEERDHTGALAMVVFRNKGPDIAHTLRGFAQPLFLPSRNPVEEDLAFSTIAKERLKSTYPFTEGPDLGIDLTRKFEGTTPGRLTKKQIKEWQAGNISLYVMGEILYKDSQGELKTEFCWIMTPPLGFKTDISIPWLPGFHGFCAEGQHNVIATPMPKPIINPPPAGDQKK